MTDDTLTKLLERLAEARDKRRRVSQRIERAQADLEEAKGDEVAIVRTLRSIGEEVPDDIAADFALERARVSGGRVRAEDAALQVVEPGEEISKQEVANRVQARGINIGSRNPANALSTAMARSRQFIRTGRGLFRRREVPRLVQNADGNGGGS